MRASHTYKGNERFESKRIFFMGSKNPGLIKHLLLPLVNLKERLLHHVTDEEIELIKNSHLFDKLDKHSFDELLKSEILIKYLADDLILKEGDIADEFYIIAEGSVRVFTTAFDNTKVPLARLNKGDYFGEQALLGELTKTRNASIEAITDTTLIKIDKEFILKLLKIDTDLRARLNKIGNQQIMHKLSATLDLYQNIKSKLQEKNEQDIIEIVKDTIIFKAGDISNYVYIILEGSVDIVLPKDKNHTTITLKKGHLFGELGVLQNRTRAATAIARELTRLLRISAQEFNELCITFPQFKKTLQTLQNTYLLPNRGVAEQSLGKVLGMDAITTIYKLNDGRTVIANHVLEKPFFTMQEENVKQAELCSYEKDSDNRIELKILKSRIVSIQYYGLGDDLSKLCLALLDGKEIPNQVLDHFRSTGEFQLDIAGPLTNKLPNVVCDCMSVKRDEIEKLISEGIKSFAMISNQTGACTVCGSCRSRILSMLGQNTWVHALMTRGIHHSDKVVSYFIQAQDGQFKSFSPGEHVVIQVRIDENWVERAYTLSDLAEQGKLRITIKKEESGFFTKWLFNNSLEQIPIYASQPQGNFNLNHTANQSILCIAGGIGITPFITFAKSLQKQQTQRRMHLIYIARTQDDFLFTDEFNDIIHTTPSISLQLWEKKKLGALPDEKIAEVLNDLEDAEVYICGPEGFEISILNTLNKLNYNAKKIHVEKFMYANPMVKEED